MENTKQKTILLGIESSGATCGVGVSINNRLVKEISVNGRNVHSEKLPMFVQSVLEDLKIEIAHLSGIVLSAGPGSFTGLRIGYSLAKGIAHHSRIPIVEVPTLDVWAYQIGPQNSKIVAAIDAYRNEIFYSIYEWKEKRFARISDYSILNIENIAERITQPTLITGAITPTLESQITKITSLSLFRNGTSKPSMDALLELGLQKFERGELSDLNNCEPFYMRKFKGVS
jgi:tRNA threonylcarbamoyladenosine biosynthesis protein TsaB